VAGFRASSRKDARRSASRASPADHRSGSSTSNRIKGLWRGPRAIYDYEALAIRPQGARLESLPPPGDGARPAGTARGPRSRANWQRLELVVEMIRGDRSGEARRHRPRRQPRSLSMPTRSKALVRFKSIGMEFRHHAGRRRCCTDPSTTAASSGSYVGLTPRPVFQRVGTDRRPGAISKAGNPESPFDHDRTGLDCGCGPSARQQP